jgi:hypothetical protein
VAFEDVLTSKNSAQVVNRFDDATLPATLHEVSVAVLRRGFRRLDSPAVLLTARIRSVFVVESPERRRGGKPTTSCPAFASSGETSVAVDARVS